MSDRVPIYQVPSAAFIVTTRDGVFFRCVLETVGESAPELRWTFTGTNAIRHVGPRAGAILYLDDLQQFVDFWWRAKVLMGYAAMDAARMRVKLFAGDN